jgi:hypothetical protein
MADEKIENPERIDEFGQSDWGMGPNQSGAYFYPTGRLGKFLARFFSTKAVPYVAQQDQEGNDAKVEPAPLAGDTVLQSDTIKPTGPPGSVLHNSTRPVTLPELEKNRQRRYREYEQMDEYPEVAAAFDIYSDDSTQRDTKGSRWNVITDHPEVQKTVVNLFDDIKLDRFYWDIVRNTVKYGDAFCEIITDVNKPDRGVQRLKILNPHFILRVENEYGYLTDFLQEIPEKGDWNAYGLQGEAMNNAKYITLDKNQIIHFRLFTSDPYYYPYGKSIAALAIRIFRSLKMMEDAMIIYRLSRAPERRIFYIDVGNLPTNKAEIFIEKLKQKFKKEKYYNTQSGGIDERYNPLSMDEDFFVPTRAGAGTKIETLRGAENLGEVDDVKYFRDKLLAVLKVPKDYIVEKDQSPERKANLSQLDVKFARTIIRVQHSIEIGFENLAKKHLRLRGFPESMIKDMRIELPDPSDMFTKRKLEIDTQKAAVVQQVVGLNLFPKSYIYKEYYDMSDAEIETVMQELEDESSSANEEQMDSQRNVMQGVGQDEPPPIPEGKDEKLDRVRKVLLSESLDTSKLRILKRINDRIEENDNV